jgi:hypothetical protein
MSLGLGGEVIELELPPLASPSMLPKLLLDSDRQKVERVTKAFMAMKKFDIGCCRPGNWRAWPLGQAAPAKAQRGSPTRNPGRAGRRRVGRIVVPAYRCGVSALRGMVRRSR